MWCPTAIAPPPDYGAQFLLEALYRAGQSSAAMALMTSRNLSSWLHMIDSLHATIATEAWDPSLKPNMTFSHAWGTAPANIVQRFVAGVEVAAPGAARLRIRPEPSGLSFFRATVPTIRGGVRVAYDAGNPARLLEINLPPNVSAQIELAPGLGSLSDRSRLRIDGGSLKQLTSGGDLVVEAPSGAAIRVAG